MKLRLWSTLVVAPLLVWLVLAAPALAWPNEAAPAAEGEPRQASGSAAQTFAETIRPILTAHCLKCHGLEAREGGLDLRTVVLAAHGGDSGPALVSGDAQGSLLVARLRDGSMPPEGELRLTPEQIDQVAAWIDAGAAGPVDDPADVTADEAGGGTAARAAQYWAFQTLAEVAVPAIAGAAEPPSPIDAFVRARLNALGLDISPPAAPLALIRRLSLDLAGLPPTPDDSAAFLADVAERGQPAAVERLVDRLLAAPTFGERWGRHWLDGAGYVDVIGSDNDAAIIKPGEGKWRYRDYVVQAWNADIPFDQFLREQLAGDELADWRTAPVLTPGMRRQLIATGYLRAGVDDTDQKELNTALIRYRVLHLTLDIVGTHLLGLTTGCARCHSHKFDPIPHQDYYRLLAVFTPAYNPEKWIPANERHLPAVGVTEREAIEAHNRQLDVQAAAVHDEIRQLEAPHRARLAEVRLAQLPEVIRADTQQALTAPAEQRTEVQRYLADKFAAQLAVPDAEVAAAIPAAEQPALAALRGRVADLAAGRKTWVHLHALYDVGPPPPTFLLRRGDHETPGRAVEPGVLSALAAPGQDYVPVAVTGSSGRRLAFAHWLTQPNTPAGSLVSRVLVNRIWQHLLGEGLVATAENLGHAGAAPSHPELLEWLAGDFVANGWQAKRMIRQIVVSRVYQQGVTAESDAAVVAGEQADPGNRLLWHARLRRLDAEVIRDSMLASSGNLERTLGGPPLPLFNRPDGMVLVDQDHLSAGQTPFRRSLYVTARRNYHLSLLADFDQPNLATNCPRRGSSAVVLQSLTLLNDATVRAQAERLAKAVLAEAGPESAKCVATAWQRVLGRPPAAEEQAWALEFLERLHAISASTAQVAVSPPIAQVQQSSPPPPGASEQQGAPPPQDTQQATQGPPAPLVDLCQMLYCTNEFLYAP